MCAPRLSPPSLSRYRPSPTCQRHRRVASPSHTQPLPTGPRCRPAPPVSYSRRVNRAPPPLHCRAAALPPAPAGWGPMPPPSELPHRARGPLSLPRFPFPCLPRLHFKRHRPPRPRSPPPTATRAIHAPLFSLPLIHAGDRAAAVFIAFQTTVIAVSPPLPPGETRLSATIALTGVAHTSLILPRSSRS
jgi:hypothetical protein